MKSWDAYIQKELQKEPGIVLLTYPYTFLWQRADENEIKRIWQRPNPSAEKIVYIHIPFCKRRCFFCNFVSYYGSPYQLITKYTGYLKKEMELLFPFTNAFATNYLAIGGGTPNILQPREMGHVLKAAHRYLNLKPDAIMSIEVLPDESVNGVMLRLLREYGMNRISLGIQTFDEKVKRLCNRFDTVRQNIRIYEQARKMGFGNINFDLIFGLPQQTLQSWIKTLKFTVELGPEHLCIYPLSARNPKVQFYKYAQRADVRQTIKIFNLTKDFLDKNGYLQTERNSFVKKGTTDIYKVFLSVFTPAVGIGLNSVSYNLDFTYKNTPNLKEYFSYLDQNRLPVNKSYRLKGNDRLRNYCIRQLGHLMIDRRPFKEKFGKDIRYYFRATIRRLARFKLIDIDKNSIKLTPKGIFYEALVKRCFYDFRVLKGKEILPKKISA